MTEVPKPIDAALDLFLYVPVGLAMTAAEELPKLAAKGRTRINTQLTMARVVGQFAVTRGRQEIEKRLAPAGAPAGPSRRDAAPATPTPAPVVAEGDDHGQHPNGKVDPVVEPAATGVASGDGGPSGPAGPVPASEELAIHGYDSLSASHVVQSLAGLSQEELTAVGDYERAHRGRRTILNRIDQLQGH